jgi:hypothetical protein
MIISAPWLMLQHFVTFREWQIRRCNAAPAIAINRDKEKGDFCSRMLLLQPPKSVCHHLAPDHYSRCCRRHHCCTRQSQSLHSHHAGAARSGWQGRGCRPRRWRESFSTWVRPSIEAISKACGFVTDGRSGARRGSLVMARKRFEFLKVHTKLSDLTRPGKNGIDARVALG